MQNTRKKSKILYKIQNTRKKSSNHDRCKRDVLHYYVTLLRDLCTRRHKYKKENLFSLPLFFELKNMATYTLEEVLKIFTNNNIPNSNPQTEAFANNTNNNLAYYNLSPEVSVIFIINLIINYKFNNNIIYRL